MSVTEYSKVLDRRVRKGGAQDQLVPTYVKIEEAIAEGRLREALEYIDFFDREAAHVYAFVFEEWIAEIGRFLTDRGMSDAEIEGVRSDLKLLVNRRFEEGAQYDRAAELAAYRMLKARLVRHLHGPAATALDTLNAWVVQWRGVHDRDLDYICGLLNAVVVRLGEEALEALYRDYLLVKVFARGFGRFDVARHDWRETFDSLVSFLLIGARLHLPDLGRDGRSITLREHDDRVEVTLSPCGSGGRITAGDGYSGTGSRAEAPYYYRFLEREHDFSWNKKGVCPYCAHCCLTYEKLPIERLGYPVMVVEPPSYRDDVAQCRFTLYKDPREVPAAAYERLGETKPAADTPLGSTGRTLDREVAP